MYYRSMSISKLYIYISSTCSILWSMLNRNTLLLPQQLDQNDLMRLGCSAGGKIGENNMKYIDISWYYPKPEVFNTNPMF